MIRIKQEKSQSEPNQTPLVDQNTQKIDPTISKFIDQQDKIIKLLQTGFNKQQDNILPSHKPTYANTSATPSVTPSNKIQITTNTDEKRRIAVIMDSNSKFINFHKLFEEDSVQVLRAGTIERAREALKSFKLYNPTDIMIHLGTNDIDTNESIHVARNILSFAEEIQSKHECKVFISPLTPRNDDLHDKAMEVNQVLKNSVQRHKIKIISQPNISKNQLHDAKHLKTKRTDGEMSGVCMMAASIYHGVTGKVASKHQLYNSQVWINPIIKSVDNQIRI